MSKRPREWDVGLQRPQRIARRGIGPSKRIKTDVAHDGEKENLRMSHDTLPSKLQSRNHDPKPAMTKAKVVPSRRQALKPKSHNSLTLRVAHPISEHVVKSNLYDDENWIGQQQELFTSILNEILETETSQAAAWDDQALERARTASFEYYQSNSFQSIVHRLSSVTSTHVD
jgi:hypothetical protein